MKVKKAKRGRSDGSDTGKEPDEHPPAKPDPEDEEDAVDDEDNEDAEDAENGENDEDAEDAEDDEDDEEPQDLFTPAPGSEEIDTDFSFFDPSAADIESVEQLLLNSGSAAYSGVDVPKLARTICDQTRVGTVVRVGSEPGAIAFVSCLDFESHREMLKPLRQLLYRSANKQETVQQLKPVLTREGEPCRTGILFCEKVINFPPMLLPKLQEAIFDEIAWAQEDEPTKELRDSFRFDNLCLITDVLMSSAGTSSNSKRRQKHKKKKCKTKSTGEATPEAEMEFFRPDDEAVWKHTSFSVSFALPGHAPIKGGLIRRRVALFFPAAAAPQIRADCEKLVAGTQG